MKENKELRELTMDEVDAVSGGGLLDNVAQIVATIPILGPIIAPLF